MLRLALYSLDALKEIRAATGIDYDRVTGGALKVYSDQESLDEAIAISERQRPLGLEFRVLDRKACLALVPALAPRIDSLAGGIHFDDEEGGDCFKFCERLAAWCARAGGGIPLRHQDRGPGNRTAPGSPASAPIGDSSAPMPTSWRSAPTVRCSMRPLGVRLPIIPVKGYSITVPRGAVPGCARRSRWSTSYENSA